MASQRIGAAAAAAALSIATAAHVSCQDKRNENSRFSEEASAAPSSTFSSHAFDLAGQHSRMVTSAERILDEARKEINCGVDSLKQSTVYQDTRIRAVVAARFADLLVRSACAILDYKLHRMIGEDDIDMSAVHERTAKSIYDACASHGGVLVKVGQYIATNAGGFVPQVYIDSLAPLQDACAPLPVEQVEEVLEEELRKLYGEDESSSDVLWKRVFREIDPVPLGSASLAQVHAATLLDGRRVALKVQRPNLNITTKADMLALALLSKAVERAFPGSGFDWMLPEFHKTIIAELDFTQEALNAERCKRMLRGRTLSTGNSLWNLFSGMTEPPHVIVPTPIRVLTTTRLLTMTFEEGFKMTDTEKLRQHGIDSRQVAASACSLFAELMMVHGFVHADPHPGNVLVRPRPQKGEFDVVLLDHGMYRRLDEQFRHNYCQLWAGLVAGNDAQALKGVRGLGFPDEYLDLMGLMLTYRIPAGLNNAMFGRQKLGSVMGKSARQELKEYLKERFGEDSFTPAAMNQFMMDQSRDLLFCLRCTNLVRGMNRDVGGTTVDRFIAFGAAASRGAKISMTQDSPATVITKDEALSILRADSDILVSVKESMNQPVATELIALERKQDMLVSRTLSDAIESYKMSFRTWWKGLLIDLIVMLSGKSMDISAKRLG